ncbi:MAG: pyridoxamine 5'-phosphate oxidase family protein [bacterium]|nr:pyridoxamine 5'-phosphate oxidase family protein [bacterium]
MTAYETSLTVLKELFQRDCQFVLSTCKDQMPSSRCVDTYYTNGSFWIVTYAKSQKVREIMANPNVALCSNLFRFSGKAYNCGHPLKTENSAIRSELIKAFEPWYFKHNDEGDEAMCYVKVEVEHGFFFKDGTGYDVDFLTQEAKQFPFEMDIMVLN